MTSTVGLAVSEHLAVVRRSLTFRAADRVAKDIETFTCLVPTNCNFSAELSHFGTSRVPTLINFSSRRSEAQRNHWELSDLTRGFARAFMLIPVSWNFGTG